MDTAAPFVVGTRRDAMFFSPAAMKFSAVHLFPRGTGIPRGDNGIKLIHNNCAKVPPETGSLVGAPVCKVEKILMPACPHEKMMG
jgi:hypothetical protein